MPLPDNEPQYWLRDSNGNLVGAFYLDANGDPAIVDENGNEASLESDGTWDVPAVSTGNELNNTKVIRPGDDWQTKIDAVTESNPNKSGRVTTVPQVDYDFSNVTFPISVGEGVTLDLTASRLLIDQNPAQVFDLKRHTVALTHGATFALTGTFTGSVWHVTDPPSGDFIAGLNAPKVLGFADYEAFGASTIIHLQQTGGGGIANTMFQIGGGPLPAIAKLEGTDANGFINGNNIEFTGELQESSSIGIELTGSGDLNDNKFINRGIQVSAADTLVRFDGGNNNFVRGKWFDPFNATNDWVWTANAGRWNIVEHQPNFADGNQVPSGTNNSGSPYNFARTEDSEFIPPSDLSAETPRYHGEVRPDNGTNTATAGVQCFGNVFTGNWVRPDGTTFAYS